MVPASHPEEFFHRRGIRGVGVETIAEAAGTTKYGTLAATSASSI